jgi:hypothetical protein
MRHAMRKYHVEGEKNLGRGIILMSIKGKILVERPFFPFPRSKENRI